MSDKQTLDVYAEKAKDYAARFANPTPGSHLKAFMNELPRGGQVLDLGCGPGNAAAAMRSAGFHVDAWDASPDMAAIAKERFDLDVKIATFDMLEAADFYDGIYANFSLLHSPKREFPHHLARIATALKQGGFFHLGLKTGSGERRDLLGRFYAFYSKPELEELLTDAGLTIETSATGEEAGLDGSISPFVILKVRK